MDTDQLACLHVCVTCRAGEGPSEPTPGRRLHAAVLSLPHPAALRVAEVVCLASCERACSAAIGMAGKWTYLLGNLAPADAADLLSYAGAYIASPNGTVLPSRRPVSLRNMVIGRLPPELAA